MANYTAINHDKDLSSTKSLPKFMKDFERLCCRVQDLTWGNIWIDSEIKATGSMVELGTFWVKINTLEREIRASCGTIGPRAWCT